MKNMTPKQLEQAAIDAHARGDTWATFWPAVAGDVRAALPDYLDRGRFIHRLVGLVASGNVDGRTAVGDLLDGIGTPAAPVPVVSDTETAARCLWRPAGEATA